MSQSRLSDIRQPTFSKPPHDVALAPERNSALPISFKLLWGLNERQNPQNFINFSAKLQHDMYTGLPVSDSFSLGSLRCSRLELSADRPPCRVADCGNACQIHKGFLVFLPGTAHLRTPHSTPLNVHFII